MGRVWTVDGGSFKLFFTGEAYCLLIPKTTVTPQKISTGVLLRFFAEKRTSKFKKLLPNILNILASRMLIDAMLIKKTCNINDLKITGIKNS